MNNKDTLNMFLTEKLNAAGYTVKKISDFNTRYQLMIIKPLTDFYIIESEALKDIKSSIAFGFTKYTAFVLPTEVYMYNHHPLRNGYGLTTNFELSTIDDLVEKVIATTKSLKNLYEK